MIETECLPFKETGYFSPLVCDYLEQKNELQSLYGHYPTLQNFEKQLTLKADFAVEKRKTLVKVVEQQYASLHGTTIKDTLTKKQLNKLLQPNCFTVTTGHQLNLFTGPLYFIYKIVSVLNMAKQLNKEYPNQHFVPVYWMATEDHDFAEINHVNHYGGRITWDTPARGPVGRLNTQSIAPILEDLRQTLGKGHRTDYLLNLFYKAYVEQKNLADATRYIVHALFGEEGLLIVDGDDAALKAQMIPYFERDLFEHTAERATSQASKFLREQYTEQVHVRAINLFYIEDNLRERIEKQGDEWVVLNTDIRFTATELKESLRNEPEKYSPNVVLRPLYQEVILPNLSYTGGGGELAYWFQLKQMFEAYEVPFPMLHLRNSVLWVPKRLHRKAQKLGLAVADVFKPLHQLSTAYVQKHSQLETDLSPYSVQLKSMFSSLWELAKQTDASMEGAVKAQEKKQLKGLENLQKKLLRAEKKRASIEMRQLEEIKQGLFPKNSLQERHDNFIAMYAANGEVFIETLLEELDPFSFQFTVFKESI